MNANGLANLNGLCDLLKFEVTSCHMTQSEIARALAIPGATVSLESERVFAEIPADSAGNLLSRMFTCRFILTEGQRPS